MRDYAKKNRRSSPPSRNNLWVVTAVLFTLAISFPLGMLYVKHKMALEKKTLTQNKENKKPLAQSKPKPPAPEFDFYTLLPKVAVPNNAPAEQNSSKKLG